MIKILRVVQVIIYSFLDQLFNIFVNSCVNWWAPLFASEDGWLPNWLKWVQTFDAELDRGVKDGFIVGHSRYISRVLWLYRNPGYGFSFYVLGMPYVNTDWKVTKYIPETETMAAQFFAVASTGHFNYYFTKWGIRVKLGWKAWNRFSPDDLTFYPEPWAEGKPNRLPFVFSLTRSKK